jgi:hypothetical protein
MPKQIDVSVYRLFTGLADEQLAALVQTTANSIASGYSDDVLFKAEGCLYRLLEALCAANAEVAEIPKAQEARHA